MQKLSKMKKMKRLENKMLKIKNLSKRYGSHFALNQINLTVNKGEIIGLLGTNGAGKSTLMNIITGYLSMTEGTVLIDGQDILEAPMEVKLKMGYLPETPPLYPDMTVSEYLKFVCHLKKVTKAKINQQIEEKMKLVNIDTVKGRLINNLSKGYKQRVGLAQALLGDPKLIILDEPTSGLDPKEITEIRALIKQISAQSTIMISSHILSEISMIADRIMILNRGEHIATGDPDDLLKEMTQANRIVVRIKGEETFILKELNKLDKLIKIEKLGHFEPNTVDILLEASDDLDVREDINQIVHQLDGSILMMKSADMTLEDLFLSLIVGIEEESV